MKINKFVLRIIMIGIGFLFSMSIFAESQLDLTYKTE